MQKRRFFKNFKKPARRKPERVVKINYFLYLSRVLQFVKGNTAYKAN